MHRHCQIINELVFNLIWIGHRRCIGTANDWCFFASLGVIRRSLTHFVNPDGLLTRSDLMASPAPVLPRSSVSRPPQMNVCQQQRFYLSYFYKVSLTQSCYLYAVPTKTPTNDSCSLLWSVWPSPIHHLVHSVGANCWRYHFCLLSSSSTAKRECPWIANQGCGSSIHPSLDFV